MTVVYVIPSVCLFVFFFQFSSVLACHHLVTQKLPFPFLIILILIPNSEHLCGSMTNLDTDMFYVCPYI